MKVWSSKLKLISTNNTSEANIIIKAAPKDGVGNILGETYKPVLVNDNRRQISLVLLDIDDVLVLLQDILINLEKFLYLRHIVMHEIGHAIGLKHIMSNECIMYPMPTNLHLFVQPCHEENALLNSLYTIDEARLNIFLNLELVYTHHGLVYRYKEKKFLTLIERFNVSLLMKSEYRLPIKAIYQNFKYLYIFYENFYCYYTAYDRVKACFNATLLQQCNVIGIQKAPLSSFAAQLVLMFCSNGVVMKWQELENGYLTATEKRWPIVWWFNQLNNNIFRIIGNYKRLYLIYYDMFYDVYTWDITRELYKKISNTRIHIN